MKYISNNHWMPKEISTAALGISLAATSNVAIQYLNSLSYMQSRCPVIIRNIFKYGCCAGSVAGIVLSTYSVIRLCKKITEKNELDKAVAATALGVILTAFTEAVGEHVWEIAPRFEKLIGHSMFYCVATNLAWQTCALIGFGGVVFTAYAAFRTGKAILGTLNPASNRENPL